jgi:hypothetical protein
MASTPLVIAFMLAVGNAGASRLTYLSCDLAGNDKLKASHFDFTLDEANGTVTFYVKEANATNVERAVFGPDTITWTTSSKYISVVRTISRVDLSFTQQTDIAGVQASSSGTCTIKTPTQRKF